MKKLLIIFLISVIVVPANGSIKFEDEKIELPEKLDADFIWQLYQLETMIKMMEERLKELDKQIEKKEKELDAN